jgi:hypothetical protein
MYATRLIAAAFACFFLAGCETIGNVAQSVADKAKGTSSTSSPEPQAAAPSRPTATAQPAGAGPTAGSSAQTQARPANRFESGGYDWLILSQSEAGIRLQTRGWATDQIAMDAAAPHCKKHGRIAQQNGAPKLALLVFVIYDFNCVR